MSYRVLVIPEDPTYDRAILAPLVRQMLAECGRPNATVRVLTNPALRGIDDVRRSIREIAHNYSHFDLLLCMVDADGRDRSHLFAQMEEIARQAETTLLCCAAVQEIEVWLLAGHVDKLNRGWQDVRLDVSVKENVFEEFLRHYGDRRRPSGGREVLMTEALANYGGILARCPELSDLQDRIRALLAR